MTHISQKLKALKSIKIFKLDFSVNVSPNLVSAAYGVLG